MSNFITSNYRCRWLGPTPAMVIWRLVQSCVPLTHFANAYRAPRTPTAVQQCLKPLEAQSEATALGNIVGDWAVLRPEDLRVPGNLRERALVFSLSESMRAFGGQTAVVEACGQCPANIARSESTGGQEFGSLGGCCQVLVLGSLDELSAQTRRLADESKPLSRTDASSAIETSCHRTIEEVAERLFDHIPLREFILASSPSGVWHRLWFSNGAIVRWSDDRMQLFLEAIGDGLLSDRNKIANSLTGWSQFCIAVSRANERGLVLETEYIPAGFSDGVDWWLLSHCSQCGAAMKSTDSQCPICRHMGGPVPEQKRRIMGWAPYRPLKSLLSQEAAARLLETATVQSSVKS